MNQKPETLETIARDIATISEERKAKITDIMKVWRTLTPEEMEEALERLEAEFLKK